MPRLRYTAILTYVILLDYSSTIIYKEQQKPWWQIEARIVKSKAAFIMYTNLANKKPLNK